MSEKTVGDHLFLSYATEDRFLADWLALKLTAEGYKVWYDRLKLLGGESYPRDIDKAILEKTFRVIAILSKNSVKKDNPLKERTLALKIASERKVDFMIPLNADGLKGTELGWMNTDLTYIPFDKSWAEGLNQLLRKLNSVSAPRSSVDEGRKNASNAFLSEENKDVKEEEEVIHSNLIELKKFPLKIKKITTKKYLSRDGLNALSASWTAYYVDAFTLLSFEEPSKEISNEIGITNLEEIEWLTRLHIEGIETKNIVKSLIARSFEERCLKLGVIRVVENRMLYFPPGLLKKDKISFINHKGRKTKIMATGLRNVSRVGNEYRYHLSPTFKTIIDNEGKIFVQVGVHVYITDINGVAFAPKRALRRRKKLCKDWWNREWLSRYLAILGFLSNQEGKIIIGSKESEISAENSFLKFKSPKRVIENVQTLKSDEKVREDIIELEETDQDEQ